MQNLTYNITEIKDNESKEPIDIDALIAQYKTDDNISKSNAYDDDSDDISCMEINYSINYTVKDLGHILDYYKINKRKLIKVEMVQFIIMFEEDPENQATVYRRKQLWAYVKQLKEDEFFSKYIIFTPPIEY
jgi:hypothetical protein